MKSMITLMAVAVVASSAATAVKAADIGPIQPPHFAVRDVGPIQPPHFAVRDVGPIQPPRFK
jgi:hypothetical protein